MNTCNQPFPHSLAAFVLALTAADPEIRKDMMCWRAWRMGGSYLGPADNPAIGSHLVEIQLYKITGRAESEDAAIQNWIDCATRVVGHQVGKAPPRKFANHSEEIASICATVRRPDAPYDRQPSFYNHSPRALGPN